MSALAAQASDFGFWGLVKETGVDDDGLSEFYNKYYSFPLYRDVSLATYASFGNKSISLPTWNPFKLYKEYKALTKRAKEKGLEGNLVGEGLKKGGFFVLDAKGEVQYALEEPFGRELDLSGIESAMESVRKGTETSQDL